MHFPCDLYEAQVSEGVMRAPPSFHFHHLPPVRSTLLPDFAALQADSFRYENDQIDLVPGQIYHIIDLQCINMNSRTERKQNQRRLKYYQNLPTWDGSWWAHRRLKIFLDLGASILQNRNIF